MEQQKEVMRRREEELCLEALEKVCTVHCLSLSDEDLQSHHDQYDL